MSNPPPTLVSTFEILFTPQLPPGLGPAPVQQDVENVVKGFFLTLTNPNPAPYVFGLGFHCNPTPGSPSQRTLASAVGFIDDGSTGAALPLAPGATAQNYYASVPVPAAGTVLVGILPAFFTGTGLATPNIEVRGWVEITLPALFGNKTGSRFVSEPQSSSPVNVLLTPEQRLTFLPQTGEGPAVVEAQSAFALPLASGAALLQVPPQPGGFIVVGPLLGS